MDNFDKMYKTWFDKLVPVAAAILNGDEAGAEDVVQDVFVELVEKPVQIRDPERYLMRAVTSRAIDVKRKLSRNPIEQLGVVV